MGEFNLYGVYVPSFLVQAILAYLLFSFLGRWTDRLIQKGWIGFAGLFNLSFYFVCLFVVHGIFLAFAY
ncbi:DUF1656 domain-containing protein [Acinetobacter sp. MD2(2019)]|uniref:DUF1656 domain-containing protein n=1 Tax=Acinetobacter sp. MD2(2019) TaxID=2605273 RepID=UPI002D1F0873|nr:DUF1656 domain-containing protein [Acinetobacter sp. MD2(2019)]MEB3754323.1 DUF1656 domain-containing protein [Acinetobacter sp. MD2(2019)]